MLATYPLIAGLENGQLFFNVVFFVVLISALVQGATISPLANKLGFSGGDKINVPHSLELVSMGKTNSEIIEIQIEEGTNVAGRELRMLLLPEDTLVTAVIRGDKLITPRGNTKLCAGDIFYVLISKPQRERVKKVFLTKREVDGDETLQA